MRAVFALLLISAFALCLQGAGAEEDLYFRSISAEDGLFVFVVGGVAGTQYRLESSTDLENWEPLGEGVVVATSPGGPAPPAGFVFIDEEGPSFFLRLVKL